MEMRHYRGVKQTRKGGTMKPLQLLILLYWLFLIGSVLTSPTSASFQDVTALKGTLSANQDFEYQSENQVVEDKKEEQKEENLEKVPLKEEQEPNQEEILVEKEEIQVEKEQVSPKETTNKSTDVTGIQEEKDMDIEAEEVVENEDGLDSDEELGESDVQILDLAE